MINLTMTALNKHEQYEYIDEYGGRSKFDTCPQTKEDVEEDQ